MPLVTLDSPKHKERFRGLFVGPTGRGKTLAAASWPGKTLILDFDKRYTPVLDWYPNRLSEIDVLTISMENWWTEFKPLVNRLAQMNPYANILFDGITAASQTAVMMQMVMKGAFDDWSKAGSIGKSVQEIKDMGKITKGGVPVPSWDEFNGEAMLIGTCLESLKSFDSNLFVMAHPVKRTIIKDGDKGGTYQSITAFGPKVESLIPTMFDNMWYFGYESAQINEPNKPPRTYFQRKVYTRPSLEYQEAKTSIKALPAVIDITNDDGKDGFNLYDKVKDYL